MKNKFVDFKVLATSLCCSVVMGLISFAFLKCLDYAADFRSFFPLCYIFLPVAGIVTAFVYKRIGGKSSMGNNIIIESANDGEKVPKRLASLTFIFSEVYVSRSNRYISAAIPPRYRFQVRLLLLL